jgi:hypothetical protein
MPLTHTPRRKPRTLTSPAQQTVMAANSQVLR